MRKRVFILNGLGWFCLFFALVMGVVRDVGLDPGRWYELQKETGVHETAGISEEDLLQLDVWLSNYFMGKLDDPNGEMLVNGAMQPAFNEKEMTHLADCRALFAPVRSIWLNIGLAVAGVALCLYGERHTQKGMASVGSAWLGSAVIAVPLAVLAVWAVIDFDSAFNLFHRILFTNDLWLLNPETDLLIRICPASMFASLGSAIGMRAAAVLLGLPLLVTVLMKADKRKRKKNENADL